MTNFRFDGHDETSFIRGVARGQRNHHPFTNEPIALKTSLSQETEPQQGLTTFTVSEVMQGLGQARPKELQWDAFNQTMSGDLGHFIDSEGGIEGTLGARSTLLAQDLAQGRRGFDDGIFTQASGVSGAIGAGVSDVTVGPGGGGGASVAGDGNLGIAGNASDGGPGTQIFPPPPGKNWPRGQLTYDQVADIIVSTGMDMEMCVVFVAIAKRESNHNTQAHNPKPPDDSYGLWQCNVYVGGGGYGPALAQANLDYWRQFDLTDPWTNAQHAMWRLEQGGTLQNTWATNLDGTEAVAGYSVVQYMGEARAAVQRAWSAK